MSRLGKRSIAINMISAMSAIAALSAFAASPAAAQKPNGYEGFSIPPLEISSEIKYAHKFVEILGSKMAYVDEGAGDPILFLSGQPTSSYMWRNIMPHLEKQGRVIAPDNIGFGKSDQPDIKYTFGDHYRYFDAFVKKLDLKNITLVVHDWGSGLGLNYARLNPDNIKAIVTMESIIAPVIPAKSYSAMRKDLAGFFTMARDPVKGRKVIIDDNGWLKEGGFLDQFTVRPIAPEAMKVYQEPHQTKKSRQQVFQWPSEMPIGQEPKAVHDIVTAYNKWLEETNVPWLFFYATPGVLNPPEAAEYWIARAKNIETRYIGHGLHYVQEDHPYAIGRAISDWYRRINKK